MLDLSSLIRALQFYSHHAHHICARIVFNQDHEILGEIYSKMDIDYDNVIERYIGLNGEDNFDEQKILVVAVQKCGSKPLKDVKENKELLKNCLDMIKEINAKIETVYKDPKSTVGLQQMIGDIASLNEVLIYKLNQRLK